jgi:hypothetical protein
MASKHVFISCADEDKAFARDIYRWLRDSHVAGWQASLNIRGGQPWNPMIDNALRSAAAVIVIMTPHATRSQWVTYEWSFALGAGVPVIPVQRRVTKLHQKLLTFQVIDFTGRRTWLNLREALQAAGLEPQAGPLIKAEFEIKDQKPEPATKGYVVNVSIPEPPKNTKKVTYEIYDETLKLLKLSSVNAETNFKAAFTTDGDVLVRAKITTRAAKPITVDMPLSKALQLTHGEDKTKAVITALTHIEEN